jgi:glutaredoxin 2
MYNNQAMINQLMRQKDNIDNLINQYSQPSPVQNIINTSGIDFEARILKDGEEAENTYVARRTMFLDKKNKKLLIKETDGTISEQYEIILPLDEKDKKILELEQRIKEMEEHEHTESNGTNDEQQ